MPKTTTQEERQIMKLVESMHLPEETKTQWVERIRNGEMSDELVDEIRQKVTEMGETEGDERAQANRTRYLTELTMLVKRWRLSSQSRHFGKR
jgi:hypothetical protein